MSKSPSAKKSAAFPPHDDIWQDASWRSRVRRRLLNWFEKNARDLPWRRRPTPYRIWVSEIMLQQTQVATVIPYFERFLKAFPTISSLANADEQTLLGHWEGLGYYRRARSMHAAAQQIVAEHGGRFPKSYEEVIELPGIGRYTAGAILSISKNVRLPILEGNTQRVLPRWVAMQGSATDTAATKLLWQIAEKMLPRDDPGTFNQAAMELGALLCTPKNPRCDECPVASLCRAKLAGLQEQIPGKVTKTAYEDRTEFALVISDTQDRDNRPTLPRFLVRSLPEGRRWAGLWDFPRTTEKSFDSVEDAARQLSSDIGVTLSPGLRLKTIKHSVTKYRISLHVHFAKLEGSNRRPIRPWRYVTLEEMAALPMSVTGRQIAKLLECDRQTHLPL